MTEQHPEEPLDQVKGRRKAIKEAARLAGIVKPVGPHTLRHCFASPNDAAGRRRRVVGGLLQMKCQTMLAPSGWVIASQCHPSPRDSPTGATSPGPATL